MITVVEQGDVPVWSQTAQEVCKSTESFREFYSWSAGSDPSQKRSGPTESEQPLVVDRTSSTDQMPDVALGKFVLAQIRRVHPAVTERLEDVSDLLGPLGR